MTTVDGQWALSNLGPSTIALWLEPWAEEFRIPARSTVTLIPFNGRESSLLGQVEWMEDHLVVWASAQTVAVLIDGVLQHSASATIPVPYGLTREVLEIVFKDQPSARLGGTGSLAIKRAS